MKNGVETAVIWQVVATRDRARRRVERYLTEGGFPVIRGGIIPVTLRLATVRAVVEINEAERQVLEAMLVCDTAQEIADRLNLSRQTVYGQTQALMEAFGVHSRHRVIVEALRIGVLDVASVRTETKQ